jgi:nitrate reductase alpha subunit
MDMNYRGIINMLVMCGCVGQSKAAAGRTMSGQEKLRPQTGWTAARLCARLEPAAAPDEFDQLLLCPYRPVALREAGRCRNLSPLAEPGDWGGSLIDYNVRAERMGWLPSAPQLRTNPLQVAAGAKAAGIPVADYVAKR